MASSSDLLPQSTVVERELLCSICTELLFDPITLLNCLHTFCGSCVKRWFSSRPHQPFPHAHRPSNLLPTCPVCRKRVQQAKQNPLIISLLDDLLRRYPDKRKNETEAAALRTIWKPGDQIFSELRGLEEEGEDGGRERRSASPYERTRSPLHRIPSPRQRAASVPTPILPLVPRQIMASGTNAALPQSQPQTLLSLLSARSSPPVNLVCDSCTSPLPPTQPLYECQSCHPLFHLCYPCHLTVTPPHPHPLTPLLLAPIPTPGVFCAACLKPTSTTPFFSCSICNDRAGWEYCLLCVLRGRICTHELTLFSPVPSPQPVPAIHPSLEEYGFQPYRLNPQPCDLCNMILGNANFLRCLTCAKSLCTTCWYNFHRRWPSSERAQQGFLECWRPACRRGYPGVVVGAPGDLVRHRGVWARCPRPRPPEWSTITEIGRGRREGTAVRAYWPEQWGGRQFLCFPKGAGVSDVVRVFVEEGREWWWGSYMGVGGLFPSGWVEVSEE